MAKILITGGSGFIGSHLGDALLEEGYLVWNFDLNDGPFSSSANFIQGDLLNIADLKKACSQVDGIVHLAAISRESFARRDLSRCVQVNVQGMANILEVVRNLDIRPWLIFGSTMDALVDKEGIASEQNQVLGPKSFYGLSKYMAELLTKKVSFDFNFRTMIFRFSDIYGSSRDHSTKALPNITKKILNGLEVELEAPNHKLCLVFWSDVVRGIMHGIKVLEKQKKSYYNEFYLCGEKLITLKDLTQLIHDTVNNFHMVKRDIPSATVSDSILAHIRRTAQELKFEPNVITLKEGIDKYLKGFLG